MKEEKKAYDYWLASLSPLSARKKRMLTEVFGKAEDSYSIEEKQLKEKAFLSEKDICVLINKE